MGCISPILVRSSKARVFVPCGKCNFCLQKKRSDWTFRLLNEYDQCETSSFLTLTYDDANLRLSSSSLPELCKRDLQLFTKRIRKENRALVDWPLRYYSCGEYGTRTLRPHFHSIMFNLHPDVRDRLSEIWGLGMVHIGDVSQASIHYVTKYVINRTLDYGDRAPPFSLMSRRPGIGSHYLVTHLKWHRDAMRTYTQVNGIKSGLPRYYKDKIFNAAERARLANVAVAESDCAYWEEMERIKRFHDDPPYYFDVSIRNAHDSVKSKVNSLNIF